MKLRTHYIISKIAVENENRLTKLEKEFFCIGSLLPDLSIMQFIHPHFYHSSIRYVVDKMKKLSGKSSLLAILEYGKMAHYCCDFCCSVHFDGTVGNPIEHIKYEYDINRYAIENIKMIKKNSDYRGNYSKLNMVFEDYKKIEKFNYLNDLIMSISASSIICKEVATAKEIEKVGLQHLEIGKII